MRNALLTIFLVCWIPVHGQPGPSIYRSMVSGCPFDSSAAINVLTAGTGFLNPDSLNSAFERFLFWHQREGYLEARIDSFRLSGETGKRELKIWIDPGPRFRFGNIALKEGQGIAEKSGFSVRIPEKGESFRALDLENAVEDILKQLGDTGYPLAEIRVRVRSTALESSVVDLDLDLERGPEIRLGGIRIQGNTVTRDRVIIRETRLKNGEIYKHSRILAVEEKLKQTGLFQNVLGSTVRFENGRAQVTFSVEEGRSSTADGILGYNPEGDGGKGVVTGMLQIQLRNLFGTGRFLEAFWEKKDALSQNIRFGYEEPWIFGAPLSIGGQFQQEIRDTTYLQRQWTLTGRFFPWHALSMEFGGGQKTVLPDSAGEAVYALEKNAEWQVYAGLDYNTLSDPINPRQGVRYRTSLVLGWREFENGSEGSDPAPSTTRKLVLDAEGAVPVSRRQVVYVGLHGAEIRSDGKILLSDQIRFGGTRTLRGYPEDAFRGSRVAWMNAEYRVLFGRYSRAFLFLDCGYYERKEETERIRGLRWGFGAGLRVETRLGVLGLDYGLGEGNTVLEGKVHVRLINRF